MSIEIGVYDNNSSNNDNDSNILQKFIHSSKDLRQLNVLPIVTIITIICVWLRIILFSDSECMIVWQQKNSNIISYMIAVKFSLTAIILLLIQHLYNYKLFQIMSDNKTIIETNLALSIIVPGLIGAGIGAALGSLMFCGIGIGISSYVGFILRSIWAWQTDVNNKNVNNNSHLYLWQVQFLFLSVYTLTCIMIFAVSSSTTHLGMYILLFTPTRVVIIIPFCCFYLSRSEPEVFNPMLGVVGSIIYQIAQTTGIYEIIPICNKIHIICKVLAHLLFGAYIFRFLLRNIKYVYVNSGSFCQDDLPQLIIIFGMILYTTYMNSLNRDIYTLRSNHTVSYVLLERLYAMFFTILYLSMAPSVAANSQVNSVIIEMSKSKAEESTKYQILSKVIPKNLFKMTLEQRTLPIIHNNVCVFYSDMGVVATTNKGAITTLKMINHINCVMNICMKVLNVNRVGSNSNSFLAEAGVAYVDNMFNNINIILNFAFLVRESLKRIFNDNSFRIRMGIHCGSCIGGLIETDYIPSFSLLGETILAVHLVESKCNIGSILITESVMHHLKSNIVTSESGIINFYGKNIKSYVFDSFKKPKSFDDLIDKVEYKYKKQMLPMPSTTTKGDYNINFNNNDSSSKKKKSKDSQCGSLDISDISFSDI